MGRWDPLSVSWADVVSCRFAELFRHLWLPRLFSLQCCLTCILKGYCVSCGCCFFCVWFTRPPYTNQETSTELLWGKSQQMLLISASLADFFLDGSKWSEWPEGSACPWSGCITSFYRWDFGRQMSKSGAAGSSCSWNSRNSCYQHHRSFKPFSRVREVS